LIDTIPQLVIAPLYASSRAIASNTAGARFVGTHSAVALRHSKFPILDFNASRIAIRKRYASHEK
jgi:hypothetical protein